MGAKLLASYETTCAHDGLHNKKYINLQNWRGLREENNGVFVILKNFRMYFIPDIKRRRV